MGATDPFPNVSTIHKTMLPGVTQKAQHRSGALVRGDSGRSSRPSLGPSTYFPNALQLASTAARQILMDVFRDPGPSLPSLGLSRALAFPGSPPPPRIAGGCTSMNSLGNNGIFTGTPEALPRDPPSLGMKVDDMWPWWPAHLFKDVCVVVCVCAGSLVPHVYQNERSAQELTYSSFAPNFCHRDLGVTC